MPLIGNPGKIWLMVEPADMRRGIDGLSVLVEQALQCSGEGGTTLTQAQWEWLIMGVDWRRLSATICVKKYS